MNWVPPPPFPCEKWLPLLSVFLLPVRISRPHSLEGEGAGGPKSYDSTESLVLSLYATRSPTFLIHSLNILPTEHSLVWCRLSSRCCASAVAKLTTELFPSPADSFFNFKSSKNFGNNLLLMYWQHSRHFPRDYVRYQIKKKNVRLTVLFKSTGHRLVSNMNFLMLSSQLCSVYCKNNCFPVPFLPDRYNRNIK